MRLILVRHGETYSNVKKILDTELPGAALTENGWTQANNIVAPLVAMEPDSIWISGALRTQQTATPLSVQTGLEPQIREGLREVAAGEFEGSSDEAHMSAYMETLIGWMRGGLDPLLGNLDDGHSTLARFDEAIADIEASGSQCSVVFSHGAIISLWVACRARGITEDMMRIPLHNTAMAILDGSIADGFRIVQWAHIKA